ncbi:transmembrane Fragile-X-F family protein [Parapusillimonas sp. JC17]|uniref:transmembrane Fragile-X-F family protein n=1 Tax=Parapusillimonas sp. JC17 TaxID=3445768 RepID=UPI003F9FB0B2
MILILVFLGALALMLIGLKLAEVGSVVSWSWAMVLSPIWAPLAAGLIVLMVALFVEAAGKAWKR